MAKQAADHFTLDLLDKPKRGRPRKPDALTPAQRAKRYRDRLRADLVALERLLATQREHRTAALIAELKNRRTMEKHPGARLI